MSFGVGPIAWMIAARTERNTSMTRWKRPVTMAVGALAVATLVVGTGASAAAAAPALPVVGCAQQKLVKLARGLTLTCKTYTLTGGASFPAHVVTIDVTARPLLDVSPANGKVWQYRGENAPGYTPDAPVSAMLPSNAVVATNGGYFDIRGDGSYSGTACSGMVRNGVILKTPARMAQGLANLVQYRNGLFGVGKVAFDGSIHAANGSFIRLTSINDLADAGPQQRCPPRLDGNNAAAGTGVTLVTPDMGAVVLPPTTGEAPNAAQFQLPNALVVSGIRNGHSFRVTSVANHSSLNPLSPLLSLPALTGNRAALVTSAAASKNWLIAHAKPGAVISVEGALVINHKRTAQIQTLIGGGAMLVALNKACPVNNTNTAAGCGGSFPLGDGGATSPHQETMFGVSQDNRRAFMVTVDQLSMSSGGISPDNDGAFMLSIGSYKAVLFDGGGSTAMVGRLPSSNAPVLLSAPNYLTQDPAGPDNQRYVSNAIALRGPLPVVAVNRR
jgi:hypothetical protein